MKQLVKDAYLFFLHPKLDSIDKSSLEIFMATLFDVYPMNNLSRCFLDDEYVEKIVYKKSITKGLRPGFRRSK